MKLEFPALFTMLLLPLVSQAQDNSVPLPKAAKPAKEHEFLKKFAGDWECENEAFFSPDQPPVNFPSTMKGQMIGNLWAVIEVKSGVGDNLFVGRGTYGFDASGRKEYFGTWVDSMSSHLWNYTGKVEGDKLIFFSEGPGPWDPGRTLKVRDTWHFKSDNEIILTGEMTDKDGKFATVMKATCRRVKKINR